MLNKFRKVLSNSRGFTILELIVVIAIMGFLVALVAPRLAGVSKKAEEPIAVTSMQRLSEAVERYIMETGKYPNKLGEIVGMDHNAFRLIREPIKYENNTYFGTNDPNTNYRCNLIWSGSKQHTSSLYSKDFVLKNALHVHELNTLEADEIKKLGITHVIDVRTGEETEIRGYNSSNRGTNVLMVGSGTNSDGGGVSLKGPGDAKVIESRDSSLYDGKYNTPNYINAGLVTNKMSRPDLVYRIVLAIGEESDLAKKGYMKNIGIHPLGIQHKDNIRFTDYSIVLPRLQSTIDRLYSGSSKTDENAAYVACIADGFDKERSPIAPNKRIDFTEPQGINDFEIMGIGGETYPVKDVYEWEIKEVIRVNGKENGVAGGTDNKKINY